jgi:murein peptide amidase A
MVATTAARVAFYCRGQEALLPWSLERCDEGGSVVRIGSQPVRTRLLSEHNASNLAAAVTAASLVGADLESVLRAIPCLTGPRGRMQRVAPGRVLAIVDYAHTPESLSRVLASARSLHPSGKLIVVGGCGGDRGRKKRPAMGAAIAAADVPIFTADYPRFEDPRAIIDTMLSGLSPSEQRRVRVELDRRRAIQQAVHVAEPGDVILLASPGSPTSSDPAAGREARHAYSRVRCAYHPHVRARPLTVALAAVVLACGLGAAAAAAVVTAHPLQLGRSQDGRPIVAVRVGDPHETRVLVVGCIHGNEGAGIAVARALEHVRTHLDLWIVPNLNPDGYARGTRQNGRGVDLNANWSSQWGGGGRPWDTYYPGPHPFSERETRIGRNLILRIRPRVTIWFHQHMNLVWAWGPSSAAGRIYARAAQMRFYHHHWLHGTATNWQNHHLPGSASFTVELPAGRLTPQQVRRQVHAVLALGAATHGPAHA